MSEYCAICRQKLSDLCIQCTTTPEEQCKIALGKCKHVFHFHCINRWLRVRECCPLDNREWELDPSCITAKSAKSARINK